MESKRRSLLKRLGRKIIIKRYLNIFDFTAHDKQFLLLTALRMRDNFTPTMAKSKPKKIAGEQTNV